VYKESEHEQNPIMSLDTDFALTEFQHPFSIQTHARDK